MARVLSHWTSLYFNSRFRKTERTNSVAEERVLTEVGRSIRLFLVVFNFPSPSFTKNQDIPRLIYQYRYYSELLGVSYFGLILNTLLIDKVEKT